MKVKTKIVSKIAALGTLAAAMMMTVSCERISVEPDTSTLKGAIEFTASIENSKDGSASSKLTPSTSDKAGAFEAGDAVGFYLLDQGTNTLTYRNVRYEAFEILTAGQLSLQFQATGITTSPYYQSFNLHTLSSYYPYDITDNSYYSNAFKFSVKTDQSLTEDLVASDFMVANHFDVKPQQSSDAASEGPLEMKFYHQMTNVIVKLRNVDDVAFDGIVTMSVENTNTSVVADITNKAGVILSGHSNVQSVTLQSLGSYKADNYENQVYFRGVVVPQEMQLGKTLIKIKLGTGLTARVFEYKPKATDVIYSEGGLIQGKEHVFDFVISGTQMELAGGKINPWGTTEAINQTLDGGGRQLLKMNLKINQTNFDATAKSKLQSITSALITIDNNVYKSERVAYNELTVSTPMLEVYYYQDDNWGYAFKKVYFQNVNQEEVMTLLPQGIESLRIPGNPASGGYSLAVGEIRTDVDGNMTLHQTDN